MVDKEGHRPGSAHMSLQAAFVAMRCTRHLTGVHTIQICCSTDVALDLLPYGTAIVDHSLLSHDFQPSDRAGSLDSEGTERFSKAMLFGEEVLAAFSNQPSKGYIWQVEQGEGIPKHPRHPFPPVSTSPFIPSDALIPYALTSSRVQY